MSMFTVERLARVSASPTRSDLERSSRNEFRLGRYQPLTLYCCYLLSGSLTSGESFKKSYSLMRLSHTAQSKIIAQVKNGLWLQMRIVLNAAEKLSQSGHHITKSLSL